MGVTFVIAAVALAGSACGGGSSSGEPKPEVLSRPTTSPSASAACQTKPTDARGVPGLEIRGRSASDTKLYGLLFTNYPVPARREAKVVWRMTGSGLVDFYATGPNGQRLTPAWGPEPHTGSNWRRTGDEWGTGFRFPVGGCWTVHVTRGGSTAYAGIRVVEG
ncbi:MAG: hypothetical protein ABI873_03215 [Marmoricola sp.]